jgi:hypothetical protein
MVCGGEQVALVCAREEVVYQDRLIQPSVSVKLLSEFAEFVTVLGVFVACAAFIGTADNPTESGFNEAADSRENYGGGGSGGDRGFECVTVLATVAAMCVSCVALAPRGATAAISNGGGGGGEQQPRQLLTDYALENSGLLAAVLVEEEDDYP